MEGTSTKTAEGRTGVLAPVVKTVRVPLPTAEAFELFTAGLGSWWPLAKHSIGQEKSRSCAFEGRAGGRLFETLDDGSECAWGTVTDWRPPHRVTFTWHPGREPASAQEVEVGFTADGEGATVVRLEHRDWHVFGDQAAAMRADYDGGWEGVLARFAERAGRG